MGEWTKAAKVGLFVIAVTVASVLETGADSGGGPRLMDNIEVARDDDVTVGDRAILFGDPASGVPSADDWARAAGTINYEIVTRVGPRVPRVFTR